MRGRAFLFPITAVLAAVAVSAAADWPRFRGPTGFGTSDDRGLPATWSAKSNIVWKTELPGPGTSSPIVVGKKVFLTCYSGYAVDQDQPGDVKDLKRHLLCLDRDRGKVLWKRDFDAVQPEHQYGQFLDLHGYASSTPASDGKTVYTFLGKSGVYAHDLDGKQLWQRSVGTGTHGWGSATSPVLHGDLVIVNASVESGALVALDRKKGGEVWRARGISDSWSTPVLVKAPNGQTELVVSASKKVLGFDPDKGKELWHADSFDWYVCPTVVANDGVVYALQNSTCVAVKAGGRGDVTQSHTLWQKNMGSTVTSPVYHKGHLYWATGTAYCLRGSDGEVVYRQGLRPAPRDVYAAPLLADGKIYYVSRTQGTYVVEAGPKFKLLAHNTIEGDDSVFNASPVVSNSQLLIRSDRYLYCIGKEQPR
jgi:outer membrane protein assembly factor BamB